MASKTKKTATSSGTSFKVLRPMYSQQLSRQLHRGEVVALEDNANIRNAVHLGYLTPTDQKPPEAPSEEETGDKTGTGE